MAWRRARPHTGVTPADTADIAAARKALEKVERQIETGRSRWPTVLEITEYLKRVHEENHLADDLSLIFRSGHQRG